MYFLLSITHVETRSCSVYAAAALRFQPFCVMKLQPNKLRFTILSLKLSSVDKGGFETREQGEQDAYL